MRKSMRVHCRRGNHTVTSAPGCIAADTLRRGTPGTMQLVTIAMPLSYEECFEMREKRMA